MKDLYLVRMHVDARHLYREHGQMRERLDQGYAVHSALASLFDGGAPPNQRVAPKPFSVISSEGALTQVLGYSRMAAQGLEERAKERSQSSRGAVLARPIESKAVPSFQTGQQLGFEVRTCPTRRLGRGAGEQAGREVDAFLAKVFQTDKDTDLRREPIYLEWLGNQLERLSGAQLLSAQIDRMSLDRVLRRTQGTDRKSKKPMLPDVTFSGRLVIQDPELFRSMVARGVGRHRSFGFGMLLLKP